MTLTFKVGRSRLFKYFIKTALRYLLYNQVWTFCSQNNYKNHDIFIGPIYSKAVAFDLDLLMKPNLMAYINNDFQKNGRT